MNAAPIVKAVIALARVVAPRVAKRVQERRARRGKEPLLPKEAREALKKLDF